MLKHSHLRFVFPGFRELGFRLLALLALTYLSAAQAATQDQDEDGNVPTFRTAVSEVRVTFFATDEKNHLVESLAKSDLAVVDNERVVRNFRSFTPSDETALDVVLLVDLSESVAPRFRVAINNVLQVVAREQSIPDDNIAVLSFGGASGGNFGGVHGEAPRPTSASIRPAVLCSSGCRASDSSAKLQALRSGGLTPLYDALIFASDFIAQHRSSGSGRENVRPVVILFSDGKDTISLHSASDALQAVEDAGALVYSVDVGDSERTSGGAFLQWVSNASGGRYFSPRFLVNENASSLLATVLDDLRASYMVTYDLPSHQAGFHAVRLLPTHNLNLTFHSRSGYDYEPSSR